MRAAAAFSGAPTPNYEGLWWIISGGIGAAWGINLVFGPLPACTFGGQADLRQVTNYQDLSWTALAGAEAGVGVNFTQQGDVSFATWFTYDADGKVSGASQSKSIMRQVFRRGPS